MTRINPLIHILIILLAGNLQAQTSADFHPYLSDTFHVNLGLFAPKQNFDIRANGSSPGDEIDFDETVGVDNSEKTFSGTFRWNFGEKWSVWGQVWTTDSKGSETLTEDVQWEDLVFQAGTNVAAGVKLQVIRLFFGREFWSGPQYEFGAGLGVHALKIDAFIEGEAFINGEESGFHRGGVDASQPLPNIGVWYYYSPSSRWLLSARVDWLSASVGDYSGNLWNAAAGANFAITDHFGLSLEYQVFRLDVDIEGGDWNGAAKISHSGPFLSLTASW
jgi:hypothetical protein